MDTNASQNVVVPVLFRSLQANPDPRPAPLFLDSVPAVQWRAVMARHGHLALQCFCFPTG